MQKKAVMVPKKNLRHNLFLWVLFDFPGRNGFISAQAVTRRAEVAHLDKKIREDI